MLYVSSNFKMSHQHEHNHQYNHAENLKGGPLAVAIGLNLFITIAQVIGGLVAGSLSLLGDALHNFSDVLSLLISYVANKLRGQHSTEHRTFGYKRAQILAAFINALTLIGVSVYLIIEAVERLFEIQPVNSDYIMLFALAGIIVNGGSAVMLIKMQSGDSNIRSAYLHLLGDLATSFAVLVGGIAIHLYQVYWLDSAITILVSIYLILIAGKLFIHTINVLMQFVPSSINIEEVSKRLQTIDGIDGLHHVHVWRLDDDTIHFEGHVKLSHDMPVSAFAKIKADVQAMLFHEFKINHCILQPETESCGGNELVVPEE